MSNTAFFRKLSTAGDGARGSARSGAKVETLPPPNERQALKPAKTTATLQTPPRINGFAFMIHLAAHVNSSSRNHASLAPFGVEARAFRVQFDRASALRLLGHHVLSPYPGAVVLSARAASDTRAAPVAAARAMQLWMVMEPPSGFAHVIDAQHPDGLEVTETVPPPPPVPVLATPLAPASITTTAPASMFHRMVHLLASTFMNHQATLPRGSSSIQGSPQDMRAG